MDVFEQFLRDHADDDTARLLLGRAKWPSIDMDLAVHTIEGRRRIRAKVPQWDGVPGMHYPTRLCTEQCSSAATARYKADLAARILASCTPGDADRTGRIADLTGGLGVDAWAFAQVTEEVLHNEMDPLLSDAVRNNFEKLGIGNVVFRNAAVVPTTTLPAGSAAGAAGSVAGILDGFRPDLTFLDPARRASDGRKVFRLEDCQPDVLTLLPELFEACPNLLFKISPMADISLVVNQLYPREIHVVGADGECKELLLWLQDGWEGPCTLQVTELAEDTATLRFPLDIERSAVPVYTAAIGLTDSLLFEPGKALAKAGLFNTISQQFGLSKFSRHTHLYLLPQNRRTAPEPDIQDFGKTYRILEVHAFSGKALKALGKAWPQAEVTARDLPLSSDELRRRLGVRSGGDIHIFGCRIADTPRLLVTRCLR